MSTMAEMALEYRMAAVKIKLKIKQLKEEGAPPNEIQAYQVVLAQLRDTSRAAVGLLRCPTLLRKRSGGVEGGKDK